MSKAAQNHLGIYISPKEICIAQVKLGKDGKAEAEHLVKFPTGFPVKEGMLRPLSLNHEFFDENAPWVAPLKQAVKKVSWNTTSVVVTLSQQFAILRYFVMPMVDRRFWNKSIPLESKKYIPVSFDEVVYDFNALPSDDGKKLGVIFGLTQRKTVEFISETLKSAGLSLAVVETTPASIERAFGMLDPKEHESRGYVHFSGNSSYMVFSHMGYPVLFREAEVESGGTMSERKRLDIKGAVQFVERYVGGKEYKAVMFSGDGADAWKNIAGKEAAPIPVEIWEPSKLFGLKDNCAASLFACAAAARGRADVPPLPDISGISTAALLEKKVQSYVWNITFLLGGLLLLLSIFAQARLFMAGSKISSLKMKVMNVPELDGLEADTIQRRMDLMSSNAIILDTLITDVDPLAPKLGAIVGLIPPDLWVSMITYTNPFSLSEIQSGGKEMRISGETFLKGQLKGKQVSVFLSGVREAKEFKSFSPPFGSVDSMMEEGGGDTGALAGMDDTPKLKTNSFAIVCNYSRK